MDTGIQVEFVLYKGADWVYDRGIYSGGGIKEQQ